MSRTTSGDVSDQIKELWSKRLFAEAEDLTFWHRFEGPEGSSMPIVRKDDLEKESGDTIKTDIVLALNGAGLTGDTDQGLLDGNEEKLVFRQTSMTVDALRHGVRWTKKGKIQINHDMRSSGLGQLRKWLAGKLDDAIWDEITGAGSTTLPTLAQAFAGANSAISGVDTTDLLDLDLISDVKAYAQKAARIEPMKTSGGEEYFGLAIDPYVNLGLKKSSAYQQAMREARERGADNPLFTGATAVWDGVIIFVSNRVPTAADGTGNAVVARNVFFGAQALSRAYAYYPDWTEQYFSYGEEQGIGTFLIKGEKLNVFDLSADGGAAAADLTAVGSMVVYSAATAPSLQT